MPAKNTLPVAKKTGRDEVKHSIQRLQILYSGQQTITPVDSIFNIIFQMKRENYLQNGFF